jgi:hypothetical protein
MNCSGLSTNERRVRFTFSPGALSAKWGRASILLDDLASHLLGCDSVHEGRASASTSAPRSFLRIPGVDRMPRHDLMK